MATVIASPSTVRLTASVSKQRSESLHRALLCLGAFAAAGLIIFLALYGAPYYTLSLDQRPFSPLHRQLRSSGTIGLRIGIFSMGLFLLISLYPLRKRWRW